MSYRVPSTPSNTSTTDNQSFTSMSDTRMNDPGGAGGSTDRLSEIESQQRAMFDTLVAIQQQLGRNTPSSSSSPPSQALPADPPHPGYVPQAPKKLVPWPSWEGEPETFGLFIFQLELKIRNERPYLGADQMVCYNILQALPKEKRPRVGQWFLTGGQKRQWDWEEFLKHVRDQFEDKQAKQNAGDKLSRIRMGDAQYFAEFLQDYEYLLAQCEGLGWDSSVKIIHLNNSINSTLRKSLISKTMPDDDYDRWVKKAKNVASRAENEPDYRPKGSTRTKTWYLAQKGSRPKTIVPENPTSPQLDADGDIPMTNANTISLNHLVAALQQAAGLGNGKTNNKFAPRSSLPRAAWKSANKVERLRSERKCISCEQKGHVSANCPSFRPAIPPSRTGTGVHKLKAQTLDNDAAEDSEDSSSEKDEP
jgi:hypothetical protein